MTTKSSTGQSSQNNRSSKQEPNHSNNHPHHPQQNSPLSGSMAARAKINFSIDSLINKDAAAAAAVAAAAAAAVAASNHTDSSASHQHSKKQYGSSNNSSSSNSSSNSGNHGGHSHHQQSHNGHHNGQHQAHNGLMIRVDESSNAAADAAERLARHRTQMLMMAPFNGQWPTDQHTPPERISASSRKRSHDSEQQHSSKRSHQHSHQHSSGRKVANHGGGNSANEDEDEEINVDDVDVESVGGGSSHEDECGSCRSSSFDRTSQLSPMSNSGFYDSMISPLGKCFCFHF